MLDASVRTQILAVLLELQRSRNLALLFITHDLSLAWSLCDRLAVMYLGRVVEQGKATDVIERPQHPYTQALVDAIPVPAAGGGGERELLSGDLPDATAMPSGCRFHPRCPAALRALRPGRSAAVRRRRAGTAGRLPAARPGSGRNGGAQSPVSRVSRPMSRAPAGTCLSLIAATALALAGCGGEDSTTDHLDDRRRRRGEADQQCLNDAGLRRRSRASRPATAHARRSSTSARTRHQVYVAFMDSAAGRGDDRARRSAASPQQAGGNAGAEVVDGTVVLAPARDTTAGRSRPGQGLRNRLALGPKRGGPEAAPLPVTSATGRSRETVLIRCRAGAAVTASAPRDERGPSAVVPRVVPVALAWR